MTLRGLDGKVAVVTGAAGGIGRAVVQRLAEEGVRVVAVDLDEAAAREVAGAAPGAAIGVAADVTTEAGVEAYMGAAVAAFGRVDLHHLNAGIAGSLADLVDLSVQEWDQVMAVNLRGPFLGVRAAFRHYLERGGTGSIVVTASIAGHRGSNDLLAYTTSKHGTLGLVRGAAVYGGPIDVRVNAVAPGIVPTPMFGPAGMEDMRHRAGTAPMRRAGRAEEVAAAVAFLLSDESSYVTGEIFAVDGGASVQNTNRRGGGAGLWDVSVTDRRLLERHGAAARQAQAAPR